MDSIAYRSTTRKFIVFLACRTKENCAIPTALNRKSYRHMARTLATQSGMTNAWLESQGLVSVRTPWIASHYPAASQSGQRGATR